MPNVTPHFKMQTQHQRQWCWSAVATSTASFYNPKTAHTQCSVVNAILQLAICCCANSSDSQCDVPHRLDQALQHVGHLRLTTPGPANWAQLNDEIRNNRPVACQMSLIGGSAHFVAISGTGTRQNDGIVIEDPLHGRTTTKLKLFAKSAHGIWGETCFTSP